MKHLSTPVLIATSALFILAFGLFSFKSLAADQKPAAQARPALTVSTVQAASSQLPILLAANGNVAAWQEASVGAESNALRLTEVLVNVGDFVKAGQVLARFAPESVQADVAQARAALAEAQASAADALANADRARSIATTGALSAQQIAQYSTAELTAKARVEAARATLTVQEIRLKHTALLAPDSGVISARSATVGAVVPAGTELFRMIRQGRLEWRAELPSDQLMRIKPGMAVQVQGAQGAQGAGGQPVAGKVRMLAPTVDAQTRNAIVYVDLPPQASAAGLRAGMFAKGEFALGGSGGVTVPTQALVVRDGFAYVFKLTADQHVQQTKVQTGRRLEGRVEVTQGLNAGDVVAANGAGFLSDGDLVKVAPAPKSGATNDASTPATAQKQ